jgi:hypothetical protein
VLPIELALVGGNFGKAVVEAWKWFQSLSAKEETLFFEVLHSLDVLD